jgi:hypothetical protein
VGEWTAGEYRIVYAGDKLSWGSVQAFSGTSNVFKVVEDGAVPAPTSKKSIWPKLLGGPLKVGKRLCLAFACDQFLQPLVG